MPFDFHSLGHLSIAWQMALIIAATFVQEDLVALAVGTAVAEGRLSLSTAAVGVFCGALSANLAFWLAGRILGPAALRLPGLRKAERNGAMDKARSQFDRSGFLAILASRFLPGTRIPVCALAGILGMSFFRYLSYSMIAILPWTALMLWIPDRIEALAESGLLWWVLPVLLAAGIAWWRFNKKKPAPDAP